VLIQRAALDQCPEVLLERIAAGPGQFDGLAESIIRRGASKGDAVGTNITPIYTHFWAQRAQRLIDICAGKTQTVPLEEVMKRYGMEG
jgi:hypothetical protein